MRTRPRTATRPTTPGAARRWLARLEALAAEFSPGSATETLVLVRGLEEATLPSATAVRRLHDVLCFLRAYPDDPEVLARVEGALAGFERRPDLRRFRAALDDSGIAGTDIYYTFFAATARWLVERFPDRVTIAWDYLRDGGRLGDRLGLLVAPSESPGLEEYDLGVRGWLARLKGPTETDAAYLLHRWWRLPMTATVREALYEEMQILLRLRAGPGGPARTREKAAGLSRGFQRGPLERTRPDLWRAAAEPPTRVRAVSRAEGARLVMLARDAMISRSRDLDAFCYGDSQDVRVVEFDRGLAFAAIGMRPERRLLLESVYGLLTLKNGVPIGYVLAAALNQSAEMAFNVFETWRGHEAAHIYGRALAVASYLFGARAFSVPPYQLGHDNEEGLASGAWWFYHKLGFHPRDPAIRKLAERERARVHRRPGHRSSVATLQRLSSVDHFHERGRPRADIMGVLPLGAVGLAVTRALARRSGADREHGVASCVEEASRTLAVPGWRRWAPAERGAFERWAPLVTLLPHLESWTGDERRALVDVIRAKGGRHESDFVRAYDAHRRLRAAIAGIARSAAE